MPLIHDVTNVIAQQPPMPWNIGVVARAAGFYWQTWMESGQLMAQLRSRRDPLDLNATPWRYVKANGHGSWLPDYSVGIPGTSG